MINMEQQKRPGKRVIDISTWSRRSNFEFFRDFINPNLGVTVRVDVRHAYYAAKTNGVSFFLSYFYAILGAVNEIQEFHYRFDQEGNVVYYDRIDGLAPIRVEERNNFAEMVFPFAENFSDEEWALRVPHVLKGTAVTADSYWKGEEDHANAGFVADFYECPDEYAVTEMEEIAIMNTTECFGLKDRVISLRVLVNMDTFLKGESAESLWLEESDYDSKVTEENSETVDIFEPGMENLFDTGRIVIDAVLDGEL